MKAPEITPEFIKALKDGITSLRRLAETLEDCPESKENTSIGEVVRDGIQRHYQNVAILTDWVQRCEKLTNK